MTSSEGADLAGFSLFDLFREEARAQLQTLSEGLVAVEADPTNLSMIEPVMRAAHSFKGAARIINLDLAVELAHAMEELLVAAQKQKLVLNSVAIDGLLTGVDFLSHLPDLEENQLDSWSKENEDPIRSHSERLLAWSTGAPIEAKSQHPTPSTSEAIEDKSLFDLFVAEIREPANSLIQELAKSTPWIAFLLESAQSLAGAGKVMGITPFVELALGMERVFQAIEHGKITWSELGKKLLVDAAHSLARIGNLRESDLAGELAKEERRFAELRSALEELALGQTPSKPEVPKETPAMPQAPASKETPPPLPKLPTNTTAATSADPAGDDQKERFVRVSAQSLTALMSLAGESLVEARWLIPFSRALLSIKRSQDRLSDQISIIQQSLSEGESGRATETIESARLAIDEIRQAMAGRILDFENHVRESDDLNSRLYREVIASRMRPFADGIVGVTRSVRDLAKNLGKKVKLEVKGQDTDVDRDILEKLDAPLNHILRNALDHGMESPEERKQAGKAETGTIKIEARHHAGMLVVSIADDGRGINVSRLRQKIVEKGLTTADVAQNLSEREVIDFLFLPGFSTADKVTEVSGRGVGLDVVQTMVHSVGGTIHVSTKPGNGTTFNLQLPITLSVLRAVLVEIAGDPYAFPLNRTDRFLKVPRPEIRSLENRQHIEVDGQNVGIVQATQLFQVSSLSENHEEIAIVLLSDGEQQYGLAVGSLIGEQDLVVRPLDRRLGKVPHVSAAALLEDGSPVLIIDVDDLLRSVHHLITEGRLVRIDQQEVDSPQEKQKRRVLVVDDSLTVRELERQLLSNKGYEVVTAVDGEDGWNHLHRESYDLVVTDLDMPKMTGIELVKRIKQDSKLRYLPVIIVSYRDKEEDRLRGLDAGANFYLTKAQIHDQTLVSAVEELIGSATE